MHTLHERTKQFFLNNCFEAKRFVMIQIDVHNNNSNIIVNSQKNIINQNLQHGTQR